MTFLAMPSPARARARELFADISSNNSSFDARAYASAGHLIIMIKATEATDYLNPRYAEWVAAAHASRLSVLHYHFCRPEHGDPLSEARWFWDQARPHFKPGVDRLVLDLETGNEETWPGFLAELDNELVRYSTLEAQLYTFGSALSSQLKIRSRRFHVAAWGPEQPGGALRRLPAGSLWAWQYTNGLTDTARGPTTFAGIGRSDGNTINPYTLRRIRRELNR
jgi:hypothetical protein